MRKWPPPLQAKLLQVLQDGEFSRLGGQQDIKVDSRIVTATNQELEGAVAEGTFREDLFYRINVVPLVLPPLRERKQDIRPLAERFGSIFAKEYGRDEWRLTESQLDLLERHPWPGNVRELENTLRRMVVLGGQLELGEEAPQELSVSSQGSVNRSEGEGRQQSLDLKAIGKWAASTAERAVMLRTLEQTRWNRKEAARRLSISYKALLYKMKENGLREVG